MSFNVTVISGDCDYGAVCDEHKPDLCLFESGAYRRPSQITNTSAHAGIPKLGFLNADAYCRTRSVFLSDMERLGVDTFFTISVSMPEYIPTAADRIFIWPNFVDQDIFRDYGEIKRVPALVTGSHAMHYPFRNRINSIISDHFPTLSYPHFGWYNADTSRNMLHDEQYARVINSVSFVATCGTIANEAVRKHFEIPACKTCLVTEQTPALDSAGFSDMQNCLYVTQKDVLDKINYFLERPDQLEKISRAGHFLVHSRHTIRHRDQIWQWFELRRTLRPGQRIVQVDPYAPLTVVDQESLHHRSVWDSRSIDRALLRNGHSELERGRIRQAEQYFLSCLNYHFMPEPCLGLALSNLHRGKPDAAARWLNRTLSADNTKDTNLLPDPVEWAWYILCALCAGRLEDAVIMANQFPGLRHIELDRCREVIGILSGRILRVDGPIPHSALSIHQRRQIDINSWIDELCVMLKTSGQVEFAGRLHRAINGGTAAPGLDIRFKSRAAKAFDGAGRSGRFGLTHWRVAGKSPWLVRRFSKARRSLQKRLTRMRSLLRSNDKLSVAVQAQARKQPVRSAIIIGEPSAHTRAFLDGLLQNPALPTCFWPGLDLAKAERLKSFPHNELKLEALELIITAKEAAGADRWDIVFFDKSASDSVLGAQAIQDAKIIIICDITTNCGYELVNKILSTSKYRSLEDDEYEGGRYAFFARNDSICASN